MYKLNGNQGLTGFRKRDGHIHFSEHEIYSVNFIFCSVSVIGTGRRLPEKISITMKL